MSKKIYQALSDDMVRRMRNWARWNAGTGNPLGFAVQPAWRDAPTGRWGEVPIGVLGGEGSDTEIGLNALAVRYCQAVKLFWQFEGQSLAYLAARCAVDYRTYEKRVIEGHQLLVAELARRSAVADVQREQLRSAGARRLGMVDSTKL